MSRIRILLLNSLEKVILYMLKISTKFGVTSQSLDPLTLSKVIVSTWKVNVRTARQPDRQTDRQTYGNFFLLVLSSKTYKT